jgi:hypothetical protein
VIQKLALLVIALCALALAHPSAADDKAPTVLRFIGEAPSVGEAGPSRFVIDAMATRGDAPDQMGVKGWLGSLPPLNDNGEIQGQCVAKQCTLIAEVQGHEMALSGELLGASGPVRGRFEIKGDVSAELASKGAAGFTPFADDVPGLGTLVKPGAVDSRSLDELLLWQNIDPAFGDDETHPLEDTQHDHIAAWQQSAGRPVNGLLLVDELDMLTKARTAAQKAAGWTTLGSPAEGWSAGYPAALLPKASRTGAEQHFDSGDGKASLVIAVDPPMNSDDFDALSDKLHAEASANAEASSLSFTRTGPDIQYAYAKAGQTVDAVYYNRKGGLVRLVYSYPSGEGPLSDIATVIAGSLRMSDQDRSAP